MRGNGEQRQRAADPVVASLLAEAWTKLAEELESNEAFRVAAKRVDIFKPQ
jgi:hypothetical protein